MGEGQRIHEDSSALWSQLQGKIDHSFIDSLAKLDSLQLEEEISPFLAETIRDIIFQLTMEDQKRAAELALKCLGLSPKFMVLQLEDDGGNYRLQKSAELVANLSNGSITAQGIIAEYMEWKRKDI